LRDLILRLKKALQTLQVCDEQKRDENLMKRDKQVSQELDKLEASLHIGGGSIS
jgi:hypothetical protein